MSKANVRDSFRAFWNLIIYIAPNDKVHNVLWEAWDDCQRRCDLGQLQYPSICWPIRGKYYEMAESLVRMMPSESEVVIDGS